MAETAAQAVPASEVVTPSGIAIAYFTEPKRLYKVRKPGPKTRWKEVPSVTTVLDCLSKDALSWWGMQVGVQAVGTLIEMGVLTTAFDGTLYGLMLVQSNPLWDKKGEEIIARPGVLLDWEAIVKIVNSHQLTVNHVKGRAADRGTGVHNALEAWAAVGKMPDPEEYSWEERGYVYGLLSFLIDAQAGRMTSEMMEVTVASVKHGFAGRFDLLANTSEPMRVVTKVYKKWEPKHTVVPPSRLLIDLKTSKEIYHTHLLQLEAYEGGLQECGYGATDARAVLHVMADGRYEFRRAKASLKQYVAILHADKAVKDVKEAMRI